MIDRPALAISSGEPAGIGPELCAMLARRHAQQHFHARLVVMGDFALLTERARRIGIDARYSEYDPAAFAPAGGVVEVWHQPLAAPVRPGHPDPTNAHSVLSMLQHASDACATGVFDALVTAPVQKSVLMDAGIPFTGHTEFFALRTHTPHVVMLLVGLDADKAPLRVALATTHIPLKDVAATLTIDSLTATLTVMARELRSKFNVREPRIAVCGLNPHAGEGGHLGREEIDVLAPAIAAAHTAGFMGVVGPLPADTVFVPESLCHYDAVLAMFHDQGLPVLKATSFGLGINVTLGLPFIRTSVDHGTALDLAGDTARAATADAGSLIAAVDLAVELAHRSVPS